MKRESAEIEDWVAQYDEEAIEPDLRIFDCHHHLWDFTIHPKLPMPWLVRKLIFFCMKPNAVGKLFQEEKTNNTFGRRLPFAARYMAPELLRDIRGRGHGGHRVVGTVYVECGWQGQAARPCLKPVGEAAMVAEVNCRHPDVCQAMVAHADLSLGAEVEPALKAYSENALVRGIRDGLAYAEDPTIVPAGQKLTMGYAYDAKFREGFALLQKYGFVFDSWHYHVNLEAFTDLARSFPQQTMVCDHIGFPLGIGRFDRQTSMLEWKGLMKKLAAHANVYVKIGGLGMRIIGFGFDERSTPPTSDELAQAWGPYVRYTLEIFGVDRCMFESNFPMDKISCSYTVLFNAFKKIVAGFPQEDKRKLFELNARRVYKIAA